MRDRCLDEDNFEKSRRICTLFRHGQRTTFSSRGIQIAVEYFLNRGFTVHVLVPRYRMGSGTGMFEAIPNASPEDGAILINLEAQGLHNSTIFYFPLSFLSLRTIVSVILLSHCTRHRSIHALANCGPQEGDLVR